jgi:MSHA biogenesis protein MshG
VIRRLSIALLAGGILATALEVLNALSNHPPFAPLAVIAPACLLLGMIVAILTPQRGIAGTISNGIAWTFGAILFSVAVGGSVALLLSPATAYLGVAFGCILIVACGNAARTARRRRGRVIVAYVAQAVQMNLPISTILDAAAKSETEAVARRIDRLRAELESGKPVGDALAIAVPQVPQRLIDLANTAERNGRLPEVLGGLLDKHYPPGREYRSLGFYGSYALILVLAISTVVTLIEIFIIPKFEQIFKDFKTPLPWITREVVVLGQLAPIVCVIALILTLIAEGRALRQLLSRAHPRMNPVRKPLDYLIWKLPVLGTLARNRGLADVCGTIAGGVEAGRPVDQAIMQAAQPHLNTVLRKQVAQWGTLSAAGAPLADAASKSGLPGLIAGITGTAVRAGNLPSALRFLAHHYESSFSRAEIMIRAAAVPATVLALGSIVLAVALALFAPMIALIQTTTVYTRYWYW